MKKKFTLVATLAGTEYEDTKIYGVWDKEIYDEYEVARDLYPTKEIYQEKVSKAKIYKNK